MFTDTPWREIAFEETTVSGDNGEWVGNPGRDRGEGGLGKRFLKSFGSQGYWGTFKMSTLVAPTPKKGQIQRSVAQCHKAPMFIHPVSYRHQHVLPHLNLGV